MFAKGQLNREEQIDEWPWWFIADSFRVNYEKRIFFPSLSSVEIFFSGIEEKKERGEREQISTDHIGDEQRQLIAKNNSLQTIFNTLMTRINVINNSKGYVKCEQKGESKSERINEHRSVHRLHSSVFFEP